MAVPNSSYSELMTTTIDSRTKDLADNYTKNNALLYRLRQKGKVKTFSGGIAINQELAYAQNGTYTRFSGYDTVNISPSDVFTSASFPIKQASVAVSMSRLEQLQNSGKEQMIDLLEARIENAEKTLIDSIGLDCYSDGSASGGKQIGGLNYLVPTDGSTGTVGGIARGTWSFWRTYNYDFSTLSITPSATTIQAAMNTTYLNVSRGADHPDLIVADNVYYGYYWASLQGNQRFTNSKLAEAGFDNIRFMGADVVFDGGIGGGIDASTMFFLNTNYIFLRPHKDENFVSADPGTRYSTNQLSMVKLITWAGNMTISNSQLQGRIQA
jgi:hypothetical protein